MEAARLLLSLVLILACWRLSSATHLTYGGWRPVCTATPIGGGQKMTGVAKLFKMSGGAGGGVFEDFENFAISRN